MARRFFIDYDGVLVKFDKTKSLEDVGKKGYNLTVEEQKGVTGGIRWLATNTPEEVEFYLLSASLNEDTTEDKNTRMDSMLPEIDREHRIFVPYGTSKT